MHLDVSSVFRHTRQTHHIAVFGFRLFFGDYENIFRLEAKTA